MVDGLSRQDPREVLSEEQITGFLDGLYRVSGYDFRGYSAPSMRRRVVHALGVLRVPDPAQLLDCARDSEEQLHALLDCLTVNVTEMFRDPGFYHILRQDILPVLATYPVINIWHAGCATGEEVFSMAVLLHEAGLLDRTRIYATDISFRCLEQAKTGILPASAMKQYTANYMMAGGREFFSDYYSARYDYAIIRQDLRERIFFTHHNLVTDKGFHEFQLVCCRNVLIYFGRELKSRVIRLMYESLSPLGFLAIGSKETIEYSGLSDDLHAVSTEHRIFRKIG